MNFALFLLLNAILLIRPEELIPDIAGLRLYLIVIVLCIVTSLPEIIEQFSFDSIARNPITFCVLGLLAAVFLSLGLRGQVGYAVDVAAEFAKVVVYYLLFVGVINSPRRLRTFLVAIVGLSAFLTTMSLLQYHEYIDIEAIRPLERRGEIDPDTGEAATFLQLRASGIYNDPNDLCLILTTGTLSCLALSATSWGFLVRLAWLAPIGLFGYAIILTQSRGGLLGLLAGLFVLLCIKLGPRRGALLGSVAFPLLVLAIGGRQSEINAGGTAQSRFQLWAEGLTQLWQNPITGIGSGEYVEEVGHVAHNSFVQAYVETGLLGGTLFLSAFVFAGVGILSIHRQPTFDNRSVAFRGLQPFVIAMIVGYAAGLYSLSRNLVVPTYMMLGLAAAYTRIALPATPADYQISGKRLRQMAVLGIVGLVVLKAFTTVFVSWG